EHLPHLDAAVDRQRRATARAGVAGNDLGDVGPYVDVKVAVQYRAADVVVGLVGAGDPLRTRAHRTVGDDEGGAGQVRSDVALGQLGVTLEVLVVEHASATRRHRLAERVRVHLTIAGHERKPELSVDVEGDRLEHLVVGDAEFLGNAGDAGQVRRMHL